MRLVWGWRVESRLAEVHRQIAARGEPVILADLSGPLLLPEENAWPLIQAAVAATTVDSPTNGFDLHPSYPPFGKKWEQIAEVSALSNAKALDLVRLARSRPRLQLRSSWPKPAINAVLAGFNEARSVCNTVSDDALFQHIRGNHAASIERLLDLMHLSGLMQQDPTLVGQLVSHGFWALTSTRVAVIAPRLPANDPEIRQGMKRLIDRLLDETDVDKNFASGWPTERILISDTVDLVSANPWALQPLARRSVLDGATSTTAIINLLAEKTASAALRRFDQLHLPEPAPDPYLINLGVGAVNKLPDVPNYARWFHGASPGKSYRRVIESHYRHLAERRTIAVLVALQFYRADHEGRWPATLGELTPKYLEAIPQDPFQEDGRPIGYVIHRGSLPDGGDRPLLCFDAGADDSAAIDTEPMTDWQHDRLNRNPPVTYRQYRDVAVWSPATRRIDAEIEMYRQQDEQRNRALQEFEQMEREEAERLKREEAKPPPPAESKP